MREVPTDTKSFGAARLQVLRYLERSKLRFSEVPLEPDWQLAPHVFIWRVFGFTSDVEPSWFAISGNLPTDYVTTHHADDARGAMRHFARVWLEAADYMQAGTAHQSFIIGRAVARNSPMAARTCASAGRIRRRRHHVVFIKNNRKISTLSARRVNRSNSVARN